MRHDETVDAEVPGRRDELRPVVGVQRVCCPGAGAREGSPKVRGLRLRGSNLERESPQGDEAGKLR